MNFLIDTNILIYSLQRRSGEVFQNFIFQLAARGVAYISVINRFELLAGTTESHRKGNIDFLESFPLLNVTGDIADRAGALFGSLKRRGITLDNEDILLTATVIEEGLAVVTTNAKHFPTLKPREQHHIGFTNRKGGAETRIVSILSP